jgi:hypothetical protein
MGTGSYLVNADGARGVGVKALIRGVIASHGCSKVNLRRGQEAAVWYCQQGRGAAPLEQ